MTIDRTHEVRLDLKEVELAIRKHVDAPGATAQITWKVGDRCDVHGCVIRYPIKEVTE